MARAMLYFDAAPCFVSLILRRHCRALPLMPLYFAAAFADIFAMLPLMLPPPADDAEFFCR